MGPGTQRLVTIMRQRADDGEAEAVRLRQRAEDLERESKRLRSAADVLEDPDVGHQG